MVLNLSRRGFLAAVGGAFGLWWYSEERRRQSQSVAVPVGGTDDRERSDVSDWLFVGSGERHRVESDAAERHSGVTWEENAVLTLEDGASVTITG